MPLMRWFTKSKFKEALEFPARLGLEFGGWALARWIAEKPLGSIPEAYRGAMREYPEQGSNAQNYRERTKANVRDGHATLILVRKLPLEGEMKLTGRCVDLAFAPCRRHISGKREGGCARVA